MTSEVVVMNRIGIALATDSAATVYVSGRPKVYHADKVFMLSSVHPVGVMVYNNSSLLGVPWETILKLFRKQLGVRSFRTLKEYGESLIAYLNAAGNLFPAQVQDASYLALLETLYRGIVREIERRMKVEFLRAVEDSTEDIERSRQVAAEVIRGALREWRDRKDVTCFDPKIGAELAGRMSGQVTIVRDQFFKPWRLGAAESQALQELAALVVSKDYILAESLTGLVIAGFGDDEHLPVMQSYELGEIFGGNLKYKHSAYRQIDARTPSVVEAFAERAMVSTYLDGISPRFRLKILEDISRLVLRVPEAIVDELPGMSLAEKEALNKKILPQSIAVFKEWWDEFETYRTDVSTPFLQSIALLPKKELAHVAASLVNLTSFQKRMSIEEDETVGGPVDVAVISKGDGFVWIERKHYFRPELNQHFFKNYGVQPHTDTVSTK